MDDLEMFHHECYGGEIYKSVGIISIDLSCQRCKKEIWILKKPKVIQALIKTAIDSQKRKVRGFKGSSLYYNKAKNQIDEEEEIDVIIIQKGSAQEEEIYCSYCGEQLMTAWSFCPFCGAEVERRIEEIKEEKKEEVSTEK